ncbi:MAG: Smr/MutS family protein, partial [Armatimonadetes bacterium]|nr:Smr/MutS family protein [Armatimonadota bacterium]
RLAERGYERACRIVAEAEEEARRIIAEMQSQPRQSKRTQQLRERLAEMKAEIEQEQEKLAGGEREQVAGQETEPEEVGAEEPQLAPGTRVRVPMADAAGVVERVKGSGKIVVRVGNLRMELSAADVTPLSASGVSAEAEALAARMRSKKRLTVPTEIHVRGMTVEEALHELDKFLDDALLAGHKQVRIVHGKGTGALRQGLHQWLSQHPAVRGFQLAPMSEGGSGVTVVEL